MTMEASTLGERVRNVRRRRGLTQCELAAAAGVSESLIKKLEQGNITDVRIETLHKIAVPLKVPTSDLMTGPEAEDPITPDRWDDVRDALYRSTPDDSTQQATPQGVLGSLAALLPAWQANQYAQVRAMLPALIRDALSLDEDEGRAARSRVLSAAAWMLNMTRQFDDAWTAARLALDAAPDPPETIAAVSMMTWCLLRQGRAAEGGALAARWADRIEPRFSRATTAELAAYGKMLLYVANAMTTDNRPGEAQDALSMARAAAARIGRDVPCNAWTTMRFGPGTVMVITAESASLSWQPDKVLAIAERARGLVAGIEPAQQLRHRLDVAGAHVSLRQYAEGITVMRELQAEAPEWLVHQRYARDILSRIIERRRTLTAEMRELADAARLPL
jgi:transcriptional regulator with XRE-family HTH domain